MYKTIAVAVITLLVSIFGIIATPNYGILVIIAPVICCLSLFHLLDHDAAFKVSLFLVAITLVALVLSWFGYQDSMKTVNDLEFYERVKQLSGPDRATDMRIDAVAASVYFSKLAISSLASCVIVGYFSFYINKRRKAV